MIDACEPPKSVTTEKVTRKIVKLNGLETKIKFEEFRSDPDFCQLSYGFRIPDKIAGAITGNDTTIAVKSSDAGLAGLYELGVFSLTPNGTEI